MKDHYKNKNNARRWKDTTKQETYGNQGRGTIEVYKNDRVLSPGIDVTSPVEFIPTWTDKVEKTPAKAHGEPAFGSGAISNLQTNLYIAKDLQTTTARPMVLPMSKMQVTLGGISCTKNIGDPSFTLNLPATQANAAALRARQNLLASQYYQLDFLTKYNSIETTPTVDPFFTFGLAANYNALTIASLFSRVLRAHAFIKEASNYDKPFAPNYQEFDAQMQKKRFIAALSVLVGNFKSMYCDHDIINNFKPLFVVEKDTKSYQTPFIWVDIDINNATTDSLKINKIDSANTPTTISLYNNDVYEIYKQNMFNMEHVFLLLNNKEVELAIVDNPGTTKTISTIKDYVDYMINYINKLSNIVNSIVTVFVDYYAAIMVVNQTGILSQGFKPGYNLATMTTDIGEINTDMNLMHLLALSSAYSTMEISSDNSLNTVSINLPYYHDFRPFPGAEANSFLKYVPTDEDYIPLVDITKIKVGFLDNKDPANPVYLIPSWAKFNSTAAVLLCPNSKYNRVTTTVEYTAANLLSNVDSVATATQVLVKFLYESICKFLTLSTIKIMTTRALNYQYVDGFLKQSYQSIAPYIYNAAPYYVGLKNVNLSLDIRAKL